MTPSDAAPCSAGTAACVHHHMHSMLHARGTYAMHVPCHLASSGTGSHVQLAVQPAAASKVLIHQPWPPSGVGGGWAPAHTRRLRSLLLGAQGGALRHHDQRQPQPQVGCRAGPGRAGSGPPAPPHNMQATNRSMQATNRNMLATKHSMLATNRSMLATNCSMQARGTQATCA